MTCYFRHMGEIFAKAGIEVNAENKKQLDATIHKLVGTEYKNCPETWKAIKKRLAEDENGFVKELKDAWSSRQA